MSRPRLLDLFCGAGGAAVGYHRAGFDVVGVDINPQPNYPLEFHQGDALTYPLDGFDAIHASPPCQAYSIATPDKSKHPDLYVQTRELLEATGLPWVIENVIGAPYRSGVVLCGSMFDLRVRRHRNFETSFALLAPSCDHKSQGQPIGVYGQSGWASGLRPDGTSRGVKAHPRDWGELMGIDWMVPVEIAQSIPPAYTEFIGEQLLAHIAWR